MTIVQIPEIATIRNEIGGNERQQRRVQFSNERKRGRKKHEKENKQKQKKTKKQH